ncbi:thiaminase-2 [Lentilactobacillus sunkii]|jgi:thiaminase/transcriptional activator TenA|uniref:Aminopyrimidine aminohydrolase n=1 Tax=Lentilactobacillus sunkii TaxID=481719 RepID=A0A1E7X9G5_9LACO|nr:thiaminase [Lentilactobacillus sunkii]OFA09754.1 thiaminase-2 [Lentilactobacillus sunkii]
MSLSQDILFEAQPYLIANEKHPFVQGIIHGKLTTDQLRYYDEQDIAFEYNEVGIINALVNYSTNTEQALLFHKRQDLQLTMLRDWLAREPESMPHAWESLKQTSIQPINQMYRQHMAATIQTHSVLQILPSFAAGEWMYIELGKWMKSQTRVQDEPFKSFLTMGNGDFEGPHGYIQQFFNIIDHEAESAIPREQEQAKQTFLKSCLLEWYFWDAAYKQITWDNWKAVALDGKGGPML